MLVQTVQYIGPKAVNRLAGSDESPPPFDERLRLERRRPAGAGVTWPIFPNLAADSVLAAGIGWCPSPPAFAPRETMDAAFAKDGGRENADFFVELNAEARVRVNAEALLEEKAEVAPPPKRRGPPF